MYVFRHLLLLTNIGGAYRHEAYKRVIFSIRPKMNWTVEHDLLLCREILVEDPFKLRLGSRERGKCWDKIAENLNSSRTSLFVDQRAVRERFVKLEQAFKRKRNEEMRASGISPEPAELDSAIEEIVERKESAAVSQNNSTEQARQEVQQQKETAKLMRKRAMERLSQTQAREGKKKRRHLETSDYLQYFKEKQVVETKMKEGRMDVEKRKAEVEERRLEMDVQLRQRE